MTERRYTEEEVAAIFERATEAQATGKSPAVTGQGLSLEELQSIGAEVGIPGELVARAARSLDAGGRPTRRSFMGFPIGVGRTVELERRLTDQEWERLVMDLRQTFDARGRIRTEGAFRQWTNGNLQALLEPTETGHRLRLRTTKGDARGMMTGGLVILGITLAMLISFALTGELARDWDSMVFLAVIGAGLFGAGALRLPGWAATRLEQMEGVASRLAAVTSSTAQSPPSADS